MIQNRKLFALASLLFLCAIGSNSSFAHDRRQTLPPTATPPAEANPSVTLPKKEGIKPYSEIMTSKAKSKTDFNSYVYPPVKNLSSILTSIKTLPINIEVVTTKTYRSAESSTDNSIVAITFEFNTPMLLLPKTPVKPPLEPTFLYFITC